MANGFLKRSNAQQKSTQEASKAQVDNQEIARVAYGLYEQRGRQDGHDQQDWFKAKEIVRQNRR